MSIDKSNPTSHCITRRGAVAAIAGGAAALAAPALVRAQPKKILLRVSTPAAAEDFNGKMWTIMKEDLERTAPGVFDIQIFTGGTLFKQGTDVTAMARGNLESGEIVPQDIAKTMPEYSIFTAPYLFRDTAHMNNVFNGDIGREMYKEVVEKMGVTVLSTYYLGTRQVNLRDVRDVKTPADLKGVKLRMPGTKEWLFMGESLGATATPLPLAEVYLALKTGTIDGQDNPLPSVKVWKFYEVTKQIVLTSHFVSGQFLGVSNTFWASLNQEQRTKVQDAFRAAGRWQDTNRIRDEQGNVDFFKTQGMTITTPDVDAFRKFAQAKYLASDYAKVWPKGLIDRINAT